MIKLKDLKCYEGAPLKHQKRVREGMAFETEGLPSAYRMEIEEYIAHLGETKALSTVISWWHPVNVLIEFIRKCCGAKANLFLYGEQLEKMYRQYLIANDFPVVRMRSRRDREALENKISSEYIAVFNNFWKWLVEKYDTQREEEKDVWDIRKIGVKVKQNEINKRYTLDFRKIPKPFRKEVKEAIYIQLSIKAMQTLKSELRAALRFFIFMEAFHPEIVDSGQIDRIIYEDYLGWLKVDSGCSNSVIRQEISGLCTLFSFIAQIYGKDNLTSLMYPQDGVHIKKKIPRTYSREELHRFNAALNTEERQMVRCIYIHELSGLRISDTLQLKKDCISEDGSCITVYQTKTNRTFQKHISPKVRTLLESAIMYTNQLGIESNLIFVRENGEPYTYEMIRYHMADVIKKHSLMLDNGEPFKFLAHQFRRTYATELTEAEFPDLYIASELGHTTTHSVSFYRKVRNSVMQEKTKPIRNHFSDLYKCVENEREKR